VGINEQGKILIHCENTTLIYHEEFNNYMKVDGAMSEDIFLENFYQKKERNIYMNYLKNGMQNTLKLMKTLMMALKIMLEKKACRITSITSLVCINYSKKLQHRHMIACQVSS